MLTVLKHAMLKSSQHIIMLVQMNSNETVCIIMYCNFHPGHNILLHIRIFRYATYIYDTCIAHAWCVSGLQELFGLIFISIVKVICK